jgi:hypothetical protein
VTPTPTPTESAHDCHLTGLKQIAGLPKLNHDELKALWREYFGVEPPAYRRGFLVTAEAASLTMVLRVRVMHSETRRIPPRLCRQSGSIVPGVPMKDRRSAETRWVRSSP